ncbi:MAG: phytanoyl-CoA dioxygenase family protein [Pseudomonadota bacterium]
MVLEQQQKAFFDLFGFLYLPGLFVDKIEEISRHFDALFEDNPEDVIEWVHEFHDNRMRRFISAVTEKDAYIADLIRDQRIAEIAGCLLGKGYSFTGSDASIYDCGTRFHQDGHSVKDDSRNIKMALYLDPIDSASGAIRLIPGSHHRGDTFSGILNRDLFLGGDKLGLETEDVPATVLPSNPGDLVLWDYRILHATSYGGNQRRMLALEFSHA